MHHADLVFHGGPVFTADTVRSRAHAVAVSGGRIVAVAAWFFNNIPRHRRLAGDLSNALAFV